MVPFTQLTIRSVLFTLGVLFTRDESPTTEARLFIQPRFITPPLPRHAAVTKLSPSVFRTKQFAAFFKSAIGHAR